MFKRLIVLLGLVGLLMPMPVLGAGIDVLKGLIPNRVGMDYLITDDYSIPSISIDTVHKRSVKINEGKIYKYNFVLPKLTLDGEGEIGLGGAVGKVLGGLLLPPMEIHIGYYSILGEKQHEGDKGYRVYLGIELF